MPILTIQLTGQGQSASGQQVTIPALVALQLRGPVVQVSVTVEQSIAQQLLATGASPPTPETGFALIDTGATSTCVDDGAAQRLNLPAIDVVTVASATHPSAQRNVHPIQIELIGLPITISAQRAIAAPLAAQGLLVSIGRDVLQHCTLFYNGPSGSFSLSDLTLVAA